MNNIERVVEYIKTRGQARPHELAQHFGLSGVMVHRILKRLVEQNILAKNGSPPQVYYTHTEPATIADYTSEGAAIVDEHRALITNTFVHITPRGEIFDGIEGFGRWRDQYKPQQSLTSLAAMYFSARQAVTDLADPDVLAVNATAKMRSSFEDCAVDSLYFYDTYSIPTFGRTKWARLVMHAKQSENTHLVYRITSTVKPSIEAIIHHHKIEAIAFIPPTLARPIQFMSVFEHNLALTLPIIPLTKVIPHQIAVAQKSLATLDERVLNAKSSIFIDVTPSLAYQRVLLLDDVVGSGASFQETAKKLRQLGIGASYIAAFAIVGSAKGFDVIRQI